MYLIDTNIFLEMLLDQQKSEDCQDLLEKLYNGDITAYVSSFALHSIEVMLERSKKIDMLKVFLRDINDSKGLKRMDTTTMEELFAVQLTKKTGLDFDDALHYFICKSFGLKVVSFDKHFDKTDIKRLEPKDVLKKS
ncbi:MAG TPA: PIN domain-containing protein [Syntrophorhabdaceae bacterium]|nr:PIN domain-containing protein [Syntrophorhabdaceae bacterium]HQM82714.1 PIN domain-containing protein [Syntrophorhabdaceae bacterium]